MPNAPAAPGRLKVIGGGPLWKLTFQEMLAFESSTLAHEIHAIAARCCKYVVGFKTYPCFWQFVVYVRSITVVVRECSCVLFCPQKKVSQFAA